MERTPDRVTNPPEPRYSHTKCAVCGEPFERWEVVLEDQNGDCIHYRMDELLQHLSITQGRATYDQEGMRCKGCGKPIYMGDHIVLGIGDEIAHANSHCVHKMAGMTYRTVGADE